MEGAPCPGMGHCPATTSIPAGRKGWVINPFCPEAGSASPPSFLANLPLKQTNLDGRSVTQLHHPPLLAAFSKIQSEPLLLKFKPSLLFFTVHMENWSFPLFCSGVLKIALTCLSSSLFLRPNNSRPFTFSIRPLIPAHLMPCNNIRAVFCRTPACSVVLYPSQLPMGYSCSISHSFLSTYYFRGHPLGTVPACHPVRDSLQHKGHLLI